MSDTATQMTIVVPPQTRTVHDWDLVLTNGSIIQLTIDESLGDTIKIGPDRTEIFLSKKPSSINPKQEMAAEDILVFTRHLQVAKHKLREVTARTPDEEISWLQTIQGISDTVQ